MVPCLHLSTLWPSKFLAPCSAGHAGGGHTQQIEGVECMFPALQSDRLPTSVRGGTHAPLDLCRLSMVGDDAVNMDTLLFGIARSDNLT